MTNKAYIVANEQQERDVLEKLEEKGALWGNGKNATNFIPFRTFPYVIYCNGDKYIFWDKLGDLDVEKIIAFDGRKEEQMSDKYIVSQKFMDALKKWKDNLSNIDDGLYISPDDFIDLPVNIMKWRDDSKYTKENNNRLIAIIRWVNGEDVFEIEKPEKWVVRSKETDSEGSHLYVNLSKAIAIPDITTYFGLESATRFDTKEEAESWANSHQEVVEVVDV